MCYVSSLTANASRNRRICSERSERKMCDRHGSRLAGESPAMALGRREHVGEGKGARRNPQLHLKEEGTSGMGPGGGQ